MTGWNSHCADDAAAHVRDVTGRDLWTELGAASPRSAREAAALYRAQGVRSLAALVTKLLGKPIAPRQAQRGDIVLKGWALGWSVGDHARFAEGELRPMREVEKAWRLERKATA